jgi:hypothetical protein
LNFGLLGGLRIEGQERMRVTLKVEYKQRAVRCNLPELYIIRHSNIRMVIKTESCPGLALEMLLKIVCLTDNGLLCMQTAYFVINRLMAMIRIKALLICNNFLLEDTCRRV